MYTGYYMEKQKREEDKYYGLLNKKQLSDLENATDIPVKSISTSELRKRIAKQRKEGASNALTDPLGIGAKGGCWR